MKSIFLLFLDVYKYLSQQSEKIDGEDSGSRLELINRCRHILIIFEIEFDEKVAETFASDHPYLDMSLNKIGENRNFRSQTILISKICNLATASPSTTPVSEYVDVTTPHAVNEICEPIHQWSMELNGSSTHENIAVVKSQQHSPVRNDLYEQCVYDTEITAKTSSSSDTLTCPFSGLPATHLELKKAVITGYLHKRRTFFGQVKKYYAGIIDDWLLLYAGGKSDLKPTICIALVHCTIQDRTAEIPNVPPTAITPTTTRKPSDAYELQLIQQLPGGLQKKFHFQVSSKQMLMDWCTAIHSRMTCGLELPTQRPRDITFIASNRRLPTPPSDEMTNLGVMTTHTESVNSVITTTTYSSSSASVVYGNTRLSNRSEDIYEEPSEMLISHYHDPTETSDVFETTSIPPSGNNLNYDIPKSPPKCVDDGLLCHHDVSANHKFSDVKNKLSSQLKGLPPISLSPTKSTTTTKATCSLSSSSVKEKSKKGAGESPSPSVKNWFLSRLNKSSATKDAQDQVSIVQPSVSEVATQCKIKATSNIRKANGSTTASPMKIFENDRSVKGGKVNMIIHQLEANGHLPIFSKTHGEQRRYTQLFSYEDTSNADDDHNYEPMTITKI